jgi:hypothetical protein
MSPAVSAPPPTLDSAHEDAPVATTPPAVAGEISGALLAQESTLREQAARDVAAAAEGTHGVAPGCGPGVSLDSPPPRRVAPATLASPVVPLAGPAAVGAPLPPLPPVIDVGAPAHAFVAKASQAQPPMAFASPPPQGPYEAQRHAPPHGQALGPGRSVAPGAARAGASTSTMALVVVGIVVAALGLAAVVVTVALMAARHSAVAPERRARPAGAAPRPKGADEPAPRHERR